MSDADTIEVVITVDTTTFDRAMAELQRTTKALHHERVARWWRQANDPEIATRHTARESRFRARTAEIRGVR